MPRFLAKVLADPESVTDIVVAAELIPSSRWTISTPTQATVFRLGLYLRSGEHLIAHSHVVRELLHRPAAIS